MKKNDIHALFVELTEMMTESLAAMAALISEIESELPVSGGTRHLRITGPARAPQYYLITRKGDHNGRYLKKTEIPLAREVAQEEYDRKVLAAARIRYGALKNCLQTLSAHPIPDLQNCSPHRRALITSRISSSEEALAAWSNQPWTQNPYELDEKVYLTRSGVMVRSKSEKIIADLLLEYGIPFKYEKETIAGGHSVYPDFTLYDVSSRHEVILEHLGLMDNAQYAAKNIRKIASYIKEGYEWGKTLFVTAEAKDAPLDIEALDLVLRRYRRK